MKRKFLCSVKVLFVVVIVFLTSSCSTTSITPYPTQETVGKYLTVKDPIVGYLLQYDWIMVPLCTDAKNTMIARTGISRDLIACSNLSVSDRLPYEATVRLKDGVIIEMRYISPELCEGIIKIYLEELEIEGLEIMIPCQRANDAKEDNKINRK
jgi:hypothetical protein